MNKGEEQYVRALTPILLSIHWTSLPGDLTRCTLDAVVGLSTADLKSYRLLGEISQQSLSTRQVVS